MSLLARLVKTSAVAQAQDFLPLTYVLQSKATGATAGLADLVPAQKAASAKTWVLETGSAASLASVLTAPVVARLIDADDGPIPSGQNSLQPGYNSTSTPGALASLRSGIVAYFATAASIPAQGIGFIFSGIGATAVLGIEVEVIANSGSATDYIASGASTSTLVFAAPVVLGDALYPLGAGGALVGPSGAVIVPASNPIIVANGAVFGVVPRPAAAAAGDLVKVTLLVKC